MHEGSEPKYKEEHKDVSIPYQLSQWSLLDANIELEEALEEDKDHQEVEDETLNCAVDDLVVGMHTFKHSTETNQTYYS